jgi:hypothetical protein
MRKLGKRSKARTNLGLMRYGWLVAALAAALALDGCATTIPDTDTTPPRVELMVSGPGIGSQRMSNPPRETWNRGDGAPYLDLERETEFRFTLTVSDQGGVARATLEMPAFMTVTELNPETTQTETGSTRQRLTLLGSRDDPRTGLIVSGRFRTPNLTVQYFMFEVESSDFGGSSGTRPNQTFMAIEAVLPE